ncbi:hypothetical protein BDW59DRAFT_138039 [Aspergillus cavernicola]|uniref:Uncharacterized protein n=1 Tax=Aspergillus cavernicola TaxID=176166 RepID=A0ABR4J181_9EURO
MRWNPLMNTNRTFTFIPNYQYCMDSNESSFYNFYNFYSWYYYDDNDRRTPGPTQSGFLIPAINDTVLKARMKAVTQLLQNTISPWSSSMNK